MRTAFLILALLAARPAAATDALTPAQAESAQCMTAIAAAEQRHGTPPGLLAAIARAESGRPVPPLPGLQPWPWAVNADGGAYYFDSKATAVAWVTAALARGVRQIDVGCMQINLQSHPNAFRSIDDAFEPASNAAYAARFLSQLQGRRRRQLVSRHRLLPLPAPRYWPPTIASASPTSPPGASRPSASAFPCMSAPSSRARSASRWPAAAALRINLARQPSRSHRRASACQVAAALGDFMPRRAQGACTARPNGAAATQAGLGGGNPLR